MNNPGIDFPWLRRIRVTFEGLTGGGSSTFESDGTQEKARIIARVEKVTQGIPSASNIMMYNLSANTRNSFKWGKTKVKIEAGWDMGPFKGLRQCFYGTIVTSLSQRAGSDIVTSINAISMAENLATAWKSYPWGPGTPVKTVLLGLAKEFKDVTIDAARIKGLDGMKIGSGGWSFCDPVRSGLDRLSAEFGFSWTICDGVLQVIKDKLSFGGATTIESPYLIDINPVITGSGSQATVTGLRIRSTFNSTVNPMFNVKVKSVIEPRYNSGTYIVQTVVHNLDCFNANSFITETNTLVDIGSMRAIHGE